MSRKVFLLVILACFAGVLSSSCKNKVEAKREGCKIRVGIVFDIGGKNDRSFNAAAWEGVKRAQKDMNICLYDVEPGNPTSIEPAMRAFAEKNFDLVIGVGFCAGADHAKSRDRLSEHQICDHRRRDRGQGRQAPPNVATSYFASTRVHILSE